GRATAEIIAEAVPAIVKDFPWPKAMRWGEGDLTWVRPLMSVLCCFDNEVVPFEIGGIASGDETRGHRSFGARAIHARNFDKYVPALTAAKVMLDGKARADLIAADAKTLCEAQGLALVEDKGLLAEVSGLTEWPVVMMGAFDEKFLALPDEVLTAAMRGHQKYFSVKNPKTGRLAAKFVFVANIEATDGGAAMRKGYERVLTARLSDAWYLYHQDLKRPLEERVADLDRVTFFEGLGSVGDKARRIGSLAKEIAPEVGADPEAAKKAALFAKADLTTGMVYEFPELQGLMGRYYYLAQHSSPLSRSLSGRGAGGEGASTSTNIPRAESPSPLSPLPQGAGAGDVNAIADAIRDHYAPKGADDDVPTAPVSVAVALADKIDTLTAFWAIGKKPTGSGDPFALRRAALGAIRTILETGSRISLSKMLINSADQLIGVPAARVGSPFEDAARLDALANLQSAPTIMEFFHERLKVYLRDKGRRHDHIDAVLTRSDGSLEDDLVLIVRKLEALEGFLKTDDGANL
ncbi:MAG TPA: glycine--tRNA ligase subunit beta, partial [Parvularcula sp.]|nr:glycine--tRNA ligase subunit beta [Parvularcula sp.]